MNNIDLVFDAVYDALFGEYLVLSIYSQKNFLCKHVVNLIKHIFGFLGMWRICEKVCFKKLSATKSLPLFVSVLVLLILQLGCCWYSHEKVLYHFIETLEAYSSLRKL